MNIYILVNLKWLVWYTEPNYHIVLGNMSGDRLGAHWNPQDFTLMILQACVGLGIAPIVDWEMEMTPVDFAAEFIVKMTYNLSLSLGKTFHVVNDKPLQSRWGFWNVMTQQLIMLNPQNLLYPWFSNNMIVDGFLSGWMPMVTLSNSSNSKTGKTGRCDATFYIGNVMGACILNY